MERVTQPTLNVGAILKTAWHNVKGSKWPIWAPFLVAALLTAVIYTISFFSLANFTNQHFLFFQLLIPVMTNVIVAPLYVGAIMVAIKKVRQESIDGASGFKYFHLYIPLVIVALMVSLAGSAPHLLVAYLVVTTKEVSIFLDIIMVLISLVIAIFFLLALPLVADKSKAPFVAIKQSLVTMPRYLPKVLLIFLVGYLFIFIAVLPAVIGMSINMIFHNVLIMYVGVAISAAASVWLVPFYILLVGVIYHHLID